MKLKVLEKLKANLFWLFDFSIILGTLLMGFVLGHVSDRWYISRQIGEVADSMPALAACVIQAERAEAMVLSRDSLLHQEMEQLGMWATDEDG